MSKKFLLGATIGAIAGFVTGILTAPKSGKETRQDIKDASVKAKDVAVEKAGQAKDATVRTVNAWKDKAGEVAGDVGEKAGEYKSRTEQAVEGAKKGFLKNPSKK